MFHRATFINPSGCSVLSLSSSVSHCLFPFFAKASYYLMRLSELKRYLICKDQSTSFQDCSSSRTVGLDTVPAAAIATRVILVLLHEFLDGREHGTPFVRSQELFGAIFHQFLGHCHFVFIEVLFGSSFGF